MVFFPSRAQAAQRPAFVAGESGEEDPETDGPVGFEATFGRRAAPTKAQPPVRGGGPAAGGNWRAVFDMPSHMLPSLATLCPAFLDSLLLREAAPTAGGGDAAEEMN